MHDERIPRGEEDLGHGRGVGERQSVGHRQRLAGMDDQLFGVRATRLDPHHLVADLPAGDAIADGGDDAGELKAWDLRRGAGLTAARVRVLAAPLQDVGSVDGRVMDVDEQVVGAGYRRFDLAEAEDLRPAVLGEHHGAHGQAAPSPLLGTNTRSR